MAPGCTGDGHRICSTLRLSIVLPANQAQSCHDHREFLTGAGAGARCLPRGSSFGTTFLSRTFSAAHLVAVKPLRGGSSTCSPAGGLAVVPGGHSGTPAGFLLWVQCCCVTLCSDFAAHVAVPPGTGTFELLGVSGADAGAAPHGQNQAGRNVALREAPVNPVSYSQREESSQQPHVL